MKKYILPILACFAVASVLAVAARQTARVHVMENTLEEIYRAAMHESQEELGAVSLHMEKLLVTADPAQTASHLHKIASAAENVRKCLTLLPLNHETAASTLRYVNQLEELAASLMTGGVLTPGAQAQLRTQLAVCTRLSGEMALAADETTPNMLTQAALTLRPLNLLANADQSMDYNDALASRLPQPPKGLPEGDITQEEAMLLARQFVGPDRVVSVRSAPGTTGLIPAFGVSVQTQDVLLNLEITRQGGQVLWMMPETASFPMTQSVETCRQAAESFLHAQGFPQVANTGYQLYDGLCVLSFAPLQEGVLLYPDLIKVQLRMDTAQVVGFDAHRYWTNHVPRHFQLPELSADEAKERLSRLVQVESARLCLMPEESRETLCYEFAVTHDENQYLIYLDASTGREVQLLKLIPTPEGIHTA